VASALVTRRFLLHLAEFILIKIMYAVDPSYARRNEEEVRKELWELEDKD
jgi:hypothetical protein